MHQIEGKAFENYLIGQSNYDATLPESIKLLLAFGLLFYLIYQCDERYDNAQYAQKQGD